jgi:Zn-dependent M28 family amino/carboxypeptidase
MQPRRSVLFLAVSGMKHGLWGSDYFVTHPVIPLQHVVAAINLDGVGSGSETKGRYGMNVPGSGYSSLGTTLSRMLAAHPELKIDTIHTYWDVEFFDSDQFMFAQQGIPSLSFGNEKWNSISDAPDHVSPERVVRVLRLVFYVSRAVAETPERPQWNPAWYAQITERP